MRDVSEHLPSKFYRVDIVLLEMFEVPSKVFDSRRSTRVVRDILDGLHIVDFMEQRPARSRS